MDTSSIVDYDSVAHLYDVFVTADYDVPFFLSETADVVGPVLELTAGTGRLSLPLLRSGARLTCVDASKGMLDVLERKLEKHGLSADLRCADVCTLQLPQTFQLAIMPFQAFMEIVTEERQLQALAAIYQCVAPGGRFICTLHNPLVRRAQVDGVLRVVGHYPTPEGNLVVSGFEVGGQPQVTRLQFFELFGRDGQLLSKRMLPMQFTMIEREDFERQLAETGFRVVELYGSYDRSAFDPKCSPVMIWIAERDA